MEIFSKIDKKILTILLVVLVVIVFVGFFLVKSILAPVKEVENVTGGAKTENAEPEVIAQPKTDQPTEIEKVPNQGGLLICVDRCGDGLCVSEDASCKNGNMNCSCSENGESCPQDCK